MNDVVIDRGNWLQTFTGQRFYAANPEIKDIDIEDIAHALSMICRFGGHCMRFYSVAEHSYWMAKQASRPNKLWALLHDATEAYMVDLPRPIKEILPDYKIAETNLMKKICERFELPQEMPAEIKKLDNAILRSEFEENMTFVPDDLPFTSYSMNVNFQYWEPQKAEEKFLEMFFSIYKAGSR
jgi:5'-deoxynucleotidase YfbR-like HD superfamily hydrolase